MLRLGNVLSAVGNRAAHNSGREAKPVTPYPIPVTTEWNADITGEGNRFAPGLTAAPLLTKNYEAQHEKRRMA